MKGRDAVPLGGLLRQLRAEQGEKLRVVAAAVSIDPASLSKIELGDRLSTLKQITKLATHFGVDEEDLQARRIAADFLGRYGPGAKSSKALLLIREGLENAGHVALSRSSEER